MFNLLERLALRSPDDTLNYELVNKRRANLSPSDLVGGKLAYLMVSNFDGVEWKKIGNWEKGIVEQNAEFGE